MGAKTGPKPLGIAGLLAKNTIPEPNSGCHLWLGWTNRLGYGMISLGHKKPHLSAHRAAWALANGPIPDGMSVCHRCDNPSCSNPEHLFLGTHKENMHDSTRKLRRTKKLTAEQVREIRASTDHHLDLAARYGVTRTMIRAIVTRRSWALLP